MSMRIVAPLPRAPHGGGANVSKPTSPRSFRVLLLLLVVFLVNVYPWTLRLISKRTTANNRLPASRLLLNTPQYATRPPPPALLLIDRSAQMRTLSEVVERFNYTLRRPNQACDPILPNVTIDFQEKWTMGTVKELYGKGTNQTTPRRRFAYALMVSNHKYIDGAMVVADSLAEYSELVKSGDCDLVLLVTEKMNLHVLEMLSYVFHRVKVMRSMDVWSDKSYYKTTFDKMYLYYLEDYETVIFFDADSLMVGNPDKLFSKVSDVHPLTAVGGSEYFQTALLILRPNIHIFLDLYLEYRYGTFGYNQWRARDGILFRNCLMKMHDNIGHPTNAVFHFYGFIKPWFNKDAVYKHVKDEALVFDEHYHTWWRRYERLHREHFAELSLREKLTQGSLYRYGESALVVPSGKRAKTSPPLPIGIASYEQLANVDPRQYMWMQRYSGGSEYLRPTFETYAKARNGSMEMNGVTIVLSLEMQSCDAACNVQSGGKRQCVAALLAHSRLNDCEFSFGGGMGTVQCTSCRASYDSDASPYIKVAKVATLKVGSGESLVVGKVGRTDDDGTQPSDGPRYDCFYNFLHEPTAKPACNATIQKGRRVCPCR